MPEPRFPILAVCTANICRSPLVEMVLNGTLDATRFEVASAGLRGFDTRPMDSMSAMEALRLGLDPFHFRSRRLTEDMIESAGLVLTATKEHRSEAIDLVPGALRRTFTLTEFAALAEGVQATSVTALVESAARNRGSIAPPEDLGDPFGRSPQVHRQTADLIESSARRIAAVLNALPTVGAVTTA